MENSNTTKAAPAPKSSNKPNRAVIIAIIIVVVCIIAGIIAAIIINNNKNNEADNPENGTSIQSPTSEEEQRVTEDTLKRYAEVTIEGYQEVDDPNTSKAVVVKVENKSDETTSLAVTIGAYDNDNNLLETSSTYAEGIEPGQSVIFNTFVFTELTEEQLSSATYKVYTAKTYTVEGLVEETGEQLEEQIEQSTEPAPTESESTESNENQ